jgi:hypothetical protein
MKGDKMTGFEDKKYPALMVQTVLLVTSVLYLQQTGPSIYILISMGLVLTLFTLQAINPRFFYYFPLSGFTGKIICHVDTYILYGLTVLALFFLVLGISQSTGIAIVATSVIALSPLIWRQYGRSWVRASLTKRLSRELHQLTTICPSCGGELQIKREVLDWNKGREYRTCLGECGREEKEIKTIIIA